LTYKYLDGEQTERLNLRYLTPSDIPEWATFFEQKDYLPYLGIPILENTTEMAKSWIGYQLERYKNNRYGHLVLIEKTSGKLIGQCGVLPRKLEGEKEFEIGFSLIPKYWGKGYAIEAARYFRDFAFENLQTDSLISIIQIDNISSRKVAEKNGMHKTIQTTYFGMEVFVYRIFREEWEKLKV
jgi:RimJ/RimL family protein N-acetyltransferase